MPAGWSAGEVPGLAWTSRQVVDHLCNTLAFYANHAVTRATSHQPRVRSLGEHELSDRELAQTVRTWSRLLAAVVGFGPDDWLGWHPLGMADGEGFIALACNELLVHTHDVASAHDEALTGDADLSQRLVVRLFPHDATRLGSHEPWDVLLYANGRRALGALPRQATWRSRPAPHRRSEGDGGLALS